MNNGPAPSRWRWLPLAAIFLAALLIRYWGIAWPALHPDEGKIASWIALHEEHDSNRTTFYPEGYFTLVKPVRRLEAIGLELQNRWHYFTGAGNTLAQEPVDCRLFARRLNVWLAAINVVLLYGLIVSVTGSCGAGLLGAAWLALVPLHVENSHYGETDIAMILMLTLSLACWVWVLKRGGALRLCLAAGITGFALGTKTTLLPLLACGLIIPWLSHGDTPWPGVRRISARTAMVVLGCLIGLVIADPRVLDVHWYWPRIRLFAGAAYAERDGLFGDDPGRWLPIVANWKGWLRSADTLGWPWIGLMLVGLVASFRKSFRCLWPVTLLFPALFFIYFVFVAPWVRGQEFMVFFPSFAIWSAMGVLALVGILKTNAIRPVLRWGVVTVITVWALADVGVAGLRRASQFAWPDPRGLAQEWLRLHAPQDRVIGFGSYTDPAFHCGQVPLVDVGPVERASMEQIRGEGVQYFIRNPLSFGRATFNPVTGEFRRAKFAANRQAFFRDAQRLWLWTSLEKSVFHFDCMPVEYWGLIHAPPALSLDLPLFQPGYVATSSREGIWPLKIPLGSVKMVEVDRYPRHLIVGGPADAGRPIYVLLQTRDRGATVRVQGMGRSHSVSLPPYTVETLTLRRPWYAPRLDAYDVLTVRAEPEKYIELIPCYAEVLLDEALVACRLIQKGYPDAALAFLKRETPPGGWTGKTVWPAFVAAVEQGDWALADKLHDRAEALLGEIDSAGTNAAPSLALNGISGIYYDDLSRLRLAPMTAGMKIPEEAGDSQPTNMVARAVLPARPARGDYELSLHAVWRLGETNNLPVSVSVAGGQPVQVTLSRDVPVPVSLFLHVQNETELCLFINSAPYHGSVELTDIELRWRLSNGLQAVARELQGALSRYDLHRQPAATPAAVTEPAKDEVTPNVEFYPFFKLVGLSCDRPKGIVQCRIRVLRDEAPTPQVVLWKRSGRPRRWTGVSRGVLTERATLSKGEECVVELPLPPGAKVPVDKMALSLMTNPKWQPRDYAITGQQDTKLLLQRWFAQSP